MPIARARVRTAPGSGKRVGAPAGPSAHAHHLQHDRGGRDPRRAPAPRTTTSSRSWTSPDPAGSLARDPEGAGRRTSSTCPTTCSARPMVFASRSTNAIREETGAARVGCAVVGIEVPHAHLHLVPVDSAHDMRLPAGPQADRDDLKAMAERLRARLSRAAPAAARGPRQLALERAWTTGAGPRGQAARPSPSSVRRELRAGAVGRRRGTLVSTSMPLSSKRLAAPRGGS